MSEEERIKISVNEEDVQNIINCYEKDIKYIEQLQQENKQLKEVIEKVRENINELIEHYKRLLNAEYIQEISVFVDKTHKNMFISNVVSSLEVMKICILDKVGD